MDIALLRKIAATKRTEPGARCEMCGEPIAEQHQHVVDVESRGMLCTCRPCYLLFTDSSAWLRYRAVPDRYLSFPDFELGPGQWEELEIPVGLAFFFYSSKSERTVAFYPGPAGATESELSLEAWGAVLARNPSLSVAAADTEALLVRGPGSERAQADCYLVPVDACYELVGQLRRVWRGFDGGQQSREQLRMFFNQVQSRCRPVREEDRGGTGQGGSP
ncbi:DUF5947 family protein [Arthrobacter sp.]|uniref:DUF5947 family protein n=1 Tax=Arthrobacter sp. TaxID=1667 RepID=UPI00339B14BF